MMCMLQSLIFPLYDKITPENIVPALKGLFKEVDAGLDALEASAATAVTWSDVLDPLRAPGGQVQPGMGRCLTPAGCALDNLDRDPSHSVLLVPSVGMHVPLPYAAISTGMRVVHG